MTWWIERPTEHTTSKGYNEDWLIRTQYNVSKGGFRVKLQQGVSCLTLPNYHKSVLVQAVAHIHVHE